MALSAKEVETNKLYALIGGPKESSSPGVGAAWVFLRTVTTWAQQGAKLTGSGEAGAGEFGNSVALSAEGKDALLGGPDDNGEVGAAWVFTRTGTEWKQQGEKLIAKGSEEIEAGESPSNARFGYSVAVSSDGNTALIGGRGGLGGVGSAWVFTRSGSTWTQQGVRLTGSGEIDGGGFGASVALSSDGNTALVGGPGDNIGVGAAWVFTRSGTVWTQQGPKLTAKAGEELGTGEFGESVALSSDGNTALVGGPGEDLGFSHRYGAAWVFTRSGSTWTQQGEKLHGPSGEIEGGEFGASVALASEGNTALIGGPTDNKGVGAAWAYTRSGSTWTQQGEKLTAKAGEEIGAGEFGASVALSSATGNTALIGADADNSAVGAAWVFTRSGSTWTQQGGKLTATSGEIGEGEFGQSVALSSEGNTALMGGPGDNEHVGAAWILTRAGSTWTQQEKLTGGGGSGVRQLRLQRGALLRRQHRARGRLLPTTAPSARRGCS